MKYTFIFHPQTQQEYLDACNWYEQTLIGLGQRFKLKVLTHLEYIADNPQAFPVKNRNYRECNISVFPYMIVYQIDPKKGIIYISAIYHTSRSPKRKYRK